MNRIKLPHMNCDQVCREIGDFVIETVIQARSSGCIVGLSGGVDSSTTAALAMGATSSRRPVPWEGSTITGR